jgi:hypothetical protein
MKSHALLIASALALVTVSSAASAQTLNSVGSWQDGGAGNTLGMVAADAFGIPGASQRLYANTHGAQMLDNGSPSVFIQAPVSAPLGYSSNYYYGSGGGGYYMGGASRGYTVR